MSRQSPYNSNEAAWFVAVALGLVYFLFAGYQFIHLMVVYHRITLGTTHVPLAVVGLFLAITLFAVGIPFVVRTSHAVMLVFLTMLFQGLSGFSYFPRKRTNTLRDWLYYTWDYERIVQGNSIRHVGVRLLGIEAISSGVGGWQRPGMFAPINYLHPD